MEKILKISLILTVLMGLSACSSENDSKNDSKVAENASNKKDTGTQLTLIKGEDHYRENYRLQVFYFTNIKMNKECLIFVHPGVEKMETECQDLKKD